GKAGVMNAGRRLAIALCALAAATGCAVSGTAAAPAAPQVLFDCRDASWHVELLGTDDKRLVLVTTPLTGERRMGNAQSSWDEVRLGHVVGQGGGHQRHIRLFDGVRHVILLEGVDGSLADKPGRTYAGVVTQTPANPKQDFEIACPSGRVNAKLVDNVWQWAQRVGAPLPKDEDEGGPFDGWF
ncbi:MAG TPA: hypothetical protein VFV30_12230, partial [Novosphingobium sp.]|nr:hypothetical protein [Novosphingobium sp.]